MLGWVALPLPLYTLVLGGGHGGHFPPVAATRVMATAECTGLAGLLAFKIVQRIVVGLL